MGGDGRTEVAECVDLNWIGTTSHKLLAASQGHTRGAGGNSRCGLDAQECPVVFFVRQQVQESVRAFAHFPNASPQTRSRSTHGVVPRSSH